MSFVKIFNDKFPPQGIGVIQMQQKLFDCKITR